MTTIRKFCCNDLLRFASVNLDHLAMTRWLDNYNVVVAPRKRINDLLRFATGNHDYFAVTRPNYSPHVAVAPGNSIIGYNCNQNGMSFLKKGKPACYGPMTMPKALLSKDGPSKTEASSQRFISGYLLITRPEDEEEIEWVPGEAAAGPALQEDGEAAAGLPIPEDGEAAAGPPIPEPIPEDGEAAAGLPIPEDGEAAAGPPIPEDGEAAAGLPIPEDGQDGEAGEVEGEAAEVGRGPAQAEAPWQTVVVNTELNMDTDLLGAAKAAIAAKAARSDEVIAIASAREAAGEVQYKTFMGETADEELLAEAAGAAEAARAARRKAIIAKELSVEKNRKVALLRKIKDDIDDMDDMEDHDDDDDDDDDD